MTKTDLKRSHPHLYTAPRDHAEIVDVPDADFLMIDGQGSPDAGSGFQQAIEALQSVAYGTKFALMAKGHDFVVPPLEAVWWWEGEKAFFERPQKDWQWTLMLRMPSFVAKADVERAKAEAAKKRGLPALSKLRFGRYHEGRVLQIMHVGPYKDEWPTILKLHAQMHESGLVPAGKHHEIYLGDPRRTKPERLKTLLRQPVRWTDEAQA